MPIKLGITGGIGSGKSVVSHLLKVMGIPVYISDVEAKRLTATDPYIRQQLIALLGEDVYAHNELNKTLLANYLFSTPAHAKHINGIIHPCVEKDFQQWLQRHSGHAIVAMESAILIEAGFANDVDYIVMVYAPLELRIARAMKRDSCSLESITQRIQHQMSDETKKEMAHYVILNDGTRSVIPQVKALLDTLCRQ